MEFASRGINFRCTWRFYCRHQINYNAISVSPVVESLIVQTCLIGQALYLEGICPLTACAAVFSPMGENGIDSMGFENSLDSE